jgi:hypothetical protein
MPDRSASGPAARAWPPCPPGFSPVGTNDAQDIYQISGSGLLSDWFRKAIASQKAFGLERKVRPKDSCPILVRYPVAIRFRLSSHLRPYRHDGP